MFHFIFCLFVLFCLQFLFSFRVYSPAKPASYSVKWTVEEKELFEQGLVNREILTYCKIILEANKKETVYIWIGAGFFLFYLFVIVHNPYFSYRSLKTRNIFLLCFSEISFNTEV